MGNNTVVNNKIINNKIEKKKIKNDNENDYPDQSSDYYKYLVRMEDIKSWKMLTKLYPGVMSKYEIHSDIQSYITDRNKSFNNNPA